VALKERSAAQEHFIDLCRLIGHPTPAEADPTGQEYDFEAGASKSTGGNGFADVWKRGYFAWEYKGQHADLGRAYQQLQQYREALQNPPLFVVCDTDRIVIHTNFTNTVSQVHTLALEDLLAPAARDKLYNGFYRPEAFLPHQTTAQVTQEAAVRFGRLAEILRKYGEDAQQTARFLIRLLFCLFAEDVYLLPKDLSSRLVQSARNDPVRFGKQLRQLFAAMATGDYYGSDEIAHFDGGLFDDDTVLQLDGEGLDTLLALSKLDEAVLAAYGWPGNLGDEEILERLLKLNLERAG
jgi:hypothetical protein